MIFRVYVNLLEGKEGEPTSNWGYKPFTKWDEPPSRDVSLIKVARLIFFGGLAHATAHARIEVNHLVTGLACDICDMKMWDSAGVLLDSAGIFTRILWDVARILPGFCWDVAGNWMEMSWELNIKHLGI